jgi:serine/threonine-protein kinase
VPAALDEVLARVLERDRDKRCPTARDVARDLQRFLVRQGAAVGPPEVAEWMRELFPEELARRQELIDQARRLWMGPVPRISPRLSGDGPSPILHGSVPEVPSQVLTRPLRLPRADGRSFVWVMSAIALLVGILGVLLVRSLSAVAPRSGPVSSGRIRPAVVEVPAPPDPTLPPEQPQELPAPVDPAPAAVTPPAPHAPPGHAAPAGPPGTVNVAAVGGWADIYVRGRRLGRTPAQITLPAGRHVIELRPFGEPPARRRPVTVPAGGTARVVVEL